MATTNYYISPQDGWVQIADAPDFLRTSAFPHTHQYYIYAGSGAPGLDASAGTGSVIFATGVPTAGEHVIIGSETYVFRASATLPFEVTIGATNLLTAVNFAAIVNAQSTLVTSVNTTGTVALTAKAVGTQGNYALSENATNVTVSGAAMTGGAPPQLGVLVCHKPFWMNVTSADKFYARVQNPVPYSNDANGSMRLDVFTV